MTYGINFLQTFLESMSWYDRLETCYDVSARIHFTYVPVTQFVTFHSFTITYFILVACWPGQALFHSWMIDRVIKICTKKSQNIKETLKMLQML